MKPPFSGVGRISALEGGLLMALPEVESGGVDGAWQSVSIGYRYGESCCTKMVGFWYTGCGDWTGVIIWAANWGGICWYATWEQDEDGLWYICGAYMAMASCPGTGIGNP
jgi:hypothetical protein